MPVSPDFDPDQLHDEIAELRGLVDRLTEVIGTGGLIQVNGTFVATDPVNGGPETWHTLGTLTGYTVVYGRYRMTAEGEIELDCQATASTNATTQAWSVTLPVAYRPATIRRADLEGGRAQVTTEVFPHITVDTTGVVNFIVQQANLSVTFEFNGTFPLD